MGTWLPTETSSVLSHCSKLVFPHVAEPETGRDAVTPALHATAGIDEHYIALGCEPYYVQTTPSLQCCPTREPVPLPQQGPAHTAKSRSQEDMVSPGEVTQDSPSSLHPPRFALLVTLFLYPIFVCGWVR